MCFVIANIEIDWPFIKYFFLLVRLIINKTINCETDKVVKILQTIICRSQCNVVAIILACQTGGYIFFFFFFNNRTEQKKKKIINNLSSQLNPDQIVYQEKVMGERRRLVWSWSLHPLNGDWSINMGGSIICPICLMYGNGSLCFFLWIVYYQ